MIYCYYPEEKDSEPPIKLDDGWKCFYPSDVQLSPEVVMERETGRSRKNVVVGKSPIPQTSQTDDPACGDATFTKSARCKVLEIMSADNLIEFAEVEYRPHWPERDYGPESGRPRKRSLGAAEIELAHPPTRVKNVLSKAPGMRGMERVHPTGRFEDRARETSFV